MNRYLFIYSSSIVSVSRILKVIFLHISNMLLIFILTILSFHCIFSAVIICIQDSNRFGDINFITRDFAELSHCV